MSDYKPVKGDRVRVVLEGEVTDDDTSAGFTVEHEVPFFYDDPGLISVEKIEPPVEVFQPGDLVRDKSLPDYTFFLVRGGRYVNKLGYLYSHREDDFTSRTHERVTLP